MTLQSACIQFLEARDAIMALAPKDAPNFAVLHNGKAAFFKVDPAGGVGVAVQPCLGHEMDVMIGTAHAAEPEVLAPPSAEKAEKPKRGRPVKSEHVGPHATSPVTTDAPVASPVAEWTQDKLRALARQVKDKIGLEKTRALIGAQIDDLKPEQYVETANKLHAALKGEDL